MTNDRDLDRQVHSWLAEPPSGPPDRDAVYARVMDRLPETRQRRLRWPFQWNPFAPGATRSADANGPHPQGRSNIMLNATRALALVAGLALAGSLAVVVDPFDASSRSVTPGAESRSVDEVAKVTGNATFGLADIGAKSIDGKVSRERGTTLTGRMTTGDARLDGDVEVMYNVDHLTLEPGTSTSLFAGEISITNEDGAWHGLWSGAEFPPGPENGDPQVTRHQATLAGSGSYEGLSALIYVYYPPGGSTPEVEGVIFPGDLPSFPDW
jgi:hypothetical protein